MRGPMKTDVRIYTTDAERHALTLLRAGFWVRIRWAPKESEADHQIDSIMPSKDPPRFAPDCTD